MASLSEALAGAEDELELDLSGSVAFGDAPYGKYVAKLHKWERSESGEKSKNPGTPMVKWYFEVVETLAVHEHEVDDEGNELPELKPAPEPGTFLPIVNTMLAGPAAWRTGELYEALGGNMNAKNAQGTTKIRPGTVVNNLVRCVKQPQDDNPQYDELTGFEKAKGKSALA